MMKADKNCKDNCEINPYDKLEKAITKVQIPNIEQLKPNSWELAANRKKLEGIMTLVKKFIIHRLADDVRYKEMMEE